MCRIVWGLLPRESVGRARVVGALQAATAIDATSCIISSLGEAPIDCRPGFDSQSDTSGLVWGVFHDPGKETLMLAALISRARDILRTEGAGALLWHTLGFVGFLFRRVYRRQDVYLYQHNLVPRPRDNFLPSLESYDLRIVHSNEEANRLVAEGLEDFRSVFVFSPRSLEKRGAIAFCVYVESELAHIGWIALDEDAKSCIDVLPYSVAFGEGQVCTGGTRTVPKYRGRGLMAYGYYERLEYLRERGYVSSRNAVEVTNVASQKAHARFAPTVYGVGRYRKLLRWSRWKEESLAASGLEAPLSRLPGREGIRVIEDRKP